MVSMAAMSSKGDHPRIRGEHETAARARPRRAGSSPHTRGALGSGLRPSMARRIIPAYAGSTDPEAPLATIDADHPRIRGEHRDP